MGRTQHRRAAAEKANNKIRRSLALMQAWNHDDEDEEIFYDAVHPSKLPTRPAPQPHARVQKENITFHLDAELARQLAHFDDGDDDDDEYVFGAAVAEATATAGGDVLVDTDDEKDNAQKLSGVTIKKQQQENATSSKNDKHNAAAAANQNKRQVGMSTLLRRIQHQERRRARQVHSNRTMRIVRYFPVRQVGGQLGTAPASPNFSPLRPHHFNLEQTPFIKRRRRILLLSRSDLDDTTAAAAAMLQ